MKDFLTKHPAFYVGALGLCATLFTRLANKFGLPLSDVTAGELAQIVGLFSVAAIGYLAAHAHGVTVGAAVAGAISAGADAAEPEIEHDLVLGNKIVVKPEVKAD